MFLLKLHHHEIKYDQLNVIWATNMTSKLSPGQPEASLRASTHMKYGQLFFYSLTQYLQWTQHFRFTLDCNNHSNSFTKNQHDQIKTLSQSKLRKHWQADTFQIFITKLGNLYGIQQQLNDLQTAPDETTPSSCSPLCLSKTPPPRQPASFLFHSKQDWGRPASSHWNPKEYNESSQH